MTSARSRRKGKALAFIRRSADPAPTPRIQLLSECRPSAFCPTRRPVPFLSSTPYALMDNFNDAKFLWRHPAPELTNMDAFRRFVNRKHGLDIRAYQSPLFPLPSNNSTEDYHQLHAYSVSDYAFWQDLWEFMGIVYSVPPAQVCVQRGLALLPCSHLHNRERLSRKVVSKRFPSGFRVHASTMRRTSFGATTTRLR